MADKHAGMTCWSIFGPVDSLGQWPFGNRGGHEEDKVFGRADGQDPARGGQHAVSEVAKKHGVSDVTIYAWRKRFGQLEPVDVRRLRQLRPRMPGSRRYWPNESWTSRS